MTTEQYLINITYAGKVLQLPVRIIHEGFFYKICVDIDGTEVSFARDDHNGLRPMNHQKDFEPQFLYLVGKAIQQQRLAYN